MDQAVPRDQLYTQSTVVHGRAMALLVRQVRLRRAAERKMRMVQQQLHHAHPPLGRKAQPDLPYQQRHDPPMDHCTLCVQLVPWHCLIHAGILSTDHNILN